jgi:hypothetical protein
MEEPQGFIESYKKDGIVCEKYFIIYSGNIKLNNIIKYNNRLGPVLLPPRAALSKGW